MYRLIVIYINGLDKLITNQMNKLSLKSFRWTINIDDGLNEGIYKRE